LAISEIYSLSLHDALPICYGFTTVRDLGCIDPDWPTVDLRNAINAGLVEGPRLIVAAHILSASAGHADLRGFYGSRWSLPVSAVDRKSTRLNSSHVAISYA